MKRLEESFVLPNGVAMPKIGFGTWLLEDGKICRQSVGYALQHGYRHIDTATDYDNEKHVGKALEKFSGKREELFVSTKLSADIKDVGEAEKCFARSLKNLQVEYLDLYLIHAPMPWDEPADATAKYDRENLALWRLMEKWQQAGLIRAIGVSNFPVSALKNIMENSETVPQVNQICYYIGCTQKKVVDFCRANRIQVVGHSPLAHGELLHNEAVLRIAKKYDKTAAQLCIAFALQNEIATLPKSTHEKYIAANAEVDFLIDEADLQFLAALTETIPDAGEDELPD